jgi:4-amino-4-deoxy-L-arabinose transferase-like glycosyltransferase
LTRPELSVLGRIREHWLLIVILLAGALVRSYAFPDVPPGLNQDEASSGYEAWALLHYGVDRNGFHFPVHLVSWGSGQNALYSYLAMPFIAAFGLNVFAVRLLSLVFGLFTLVAFHRFVKALSDQPTALCAAFLLAVNPWHIMLSRWALESNLFPGIFLVGAWLLVRATEAPRLLPLSFACFAVSLYAYGPAYLVVPLFLGLASAYLAWHGKTSRRGLLGAWALFLVLALPIALFVLVNFLKLDSIDLGVFSIPRLPDAPRFEVVTSMFGGSVIAQFGHNFGQFLHLLASQDDTGVYNRILGFGFAYPFYLPIASLGLLLILREIRHLRHYNPRFLLAAWFLAGGLLGFFYTDPNINRLNILFLPILFFMAVALVQILRWAWAYSPWAGRGALAGLLLLFLTFFGRFTQAYFTSFSAQISPLFFEGFGDAIVYADRNAPGPICVTNRVNMPYIYVLFYTRTDPRAFLSTVRWTKDPRDDWRRAASFGRYSFGAKNCTDAREATFIVHRDEIRGAFRTGDVVQPFKSYVVVLPRPSR